MSSLNKLCIIIFTSIKTEVSLLNISTHQTCYFGSYFTFQTCALSLMSLSFKGLLLLNYQTYTLSSGTVSALTVFVVLYVSSLWCVSEISVSNLIQ